MTLIGPFIVSVFKPNHVRFIGLSFMILLGAVLLQQFHETVQTYQIAIECIVCCVCIRKLLHLFTLSLCVSVVIHFCCFMVRAMWWDMRYSLTYIQCVNVLFGMVICLYNPRDGQKTDGIQTRTRPSFDIEDKYKEAATSIYDTVMSLEPYNLEFFAQRVAEYGATQYVNCNECKKQFGFVECWNNDLLWDQNIVLLRKLYDVRYYLVCEVNSDMLDDEMQYDYIANHKEILCYECGEKWRCGICHYQTFGFNWMYELIRGGCYYCKQNICEKCSLYVESRKVGICENCYRDYDICEIEEDEEGTIIDILN
eukprot:307722_1